MLYSKTTNAFYHPAVNAGIPADAVAVPDATYQALLAAQASGQMIKADANGNPIASAAPQPPLAQRWAAYQAQAQAALNESDRTMLRCFEHGIVPPAAWVAYRAALRAITGATVMGDPTQPLPAMPPYPPSTN